MSVRDCDGVRERLVDLLAGELGEREDARVRAHLRSCASCARELEELGAVWDDLDPGRSAEVRPAREVRTAVLAEARAELARSPRLGPGLKRALDGIVLPVVAGAAASMALIVWTHFRGAIADLSQPVLVGLSLALAAGLAVAGGAVMRARFAPGLRAMLTGSLAAFGGYALLTAIWPISDTVSFCGLLLFGTVRLSLGELCLTYLGVASLYAGVPMAIAAYVWGGTGDRRIGMMEGLAFTILAVPLLLLQSGFEPWVTPLGAIAGFGLGALAGVAAGRWTHAWVVEGAA